MQSKNEYLNSVLNEIRFRAARKYLRRELEQHIDDRTYEFSEKGVKGAEDAAIAAMGDAKETGCALNAVHRPRTEWGVIACILLLSLAGIAAAYTGPGQEYSNYSQTIWSNLQSGLPLFLSFGLCLMVGLNFFDYTRLLRLRHMFFGIASALMAGYIIAVSVLQPLYSSDYTGRIIWAAVVNHFLSAVILISPLFFILGASGYVRLSKDKGIKGTVRVAILFAVSLFVLYALIAATVSPFAARIYSYLLAVVYIFMMFVNTYSGVQRKKWLHFAIVFGTIMIILVLSLYTAPFSGALLAGNDGGDHFSPQYGAQTIMNELLRDAKLAGGVSPQFIQTTEWRFFNNPQYMITAFIAEYGWLAASAVVLVFATLFVFMLSRSLKIADPFGRLLASGIAALFLLRLALFILAFAGFFENVPVVLPFVSCGSFYYVTDALLIGIFLSVWRRSSFMKGDTAPA